MYSRTGSTNTMSYFLEDHQGGVATIASNSGASDVNESFSALGLRREPTTWSGAPGGAELSEIASLSRQGYTFQTWLGQSMGLNHMNGRVQDALSGRFLSADPNIPDPSNAQSYNRYSYVNNNPLTNVDPSGFASLKCNEGCFPDNEGSTGWSGGSLGWGVVPNGPNATVDMDGTIDGVDDGETSDLDSSGGTQSPGATSDNGNSTNIAANSNSTTSGSDPATTTDGPSPSDASSAQSQNSTDGDAPSQSGLGLSQGQWAQLSQITARAQTPTPLADPSPSDSPSDQPVAPGNPCGCGDKGQQAIDEWETYLDALKNGDTQIAINNFLRYYRDIGQPFNPEDYGKPGP